MNYMNYLQKMPEQIMSTMTFKVQNIGTIFAFVLCMTLGYLLYTHSLKMVSNEGIDPYPLQLHTWMITIDSIGSITFWLLAFKYHFFWVFVVMGIGLPIWVMMEAYSIYRAVKYNREEEFKGLSKSTIDEKTAWLYASGMVLMSFFINMWVLSMIGGMSNAAIFIVYPFTNYVFVFWTWRTWTKRGVTTNRVGNSMGLQWIIFLQVSVMWIPGLSWYTAVSPFFQETWFYLAGISTSLLAMYNLVSLSKLSPKAPEMNGKKTVW